MPSSSPPFPIWLVALIPLAFFIVFPLFWCFVVWLISQFSGWSRLASTYAAKSPPKGRCGQASSAWWEWPATRGC
ncbi:hypothetical protein [Verrucomicrobium sp. BvORR106]|uniref:hypothetical protein n=1 Tax=Verrucomicrobium sp. BvORR106 TaxID=1403819 RepID=UPI002240F8FF|nr:hypothetical protein [Verrucomicrobium sp. BvORR106]